MLTILKNVKSTLNEEKKLEGDASYIFMKTKPIEELYDLQNDPFEVDNLAEDSKHSNRVNKYRKVLTQWQLEIDDKGFIPEHNLIEMFWPKMTQPITENVSIETLKKGMIKLTCATEGASIGYQIGSDIGSKFWKLYHLPIKIDKNQKICARAIKIGFKASEITSN